MIADIDEKRDGLFFYHAHDDAHAVIHREAMERLHATVEFVKAYAPVIDGILEKLYSSFHFLLKLWAESLVRTDVMISKDDS